MKLLIGGMMIAVLVFAGCAAQKNAQKPAQTANPPATSNNHPAQPQAQPPAQPPAQPQGGGMYEVKMGQVDITGPQSWKAVVDKIAPMMNKAFIGPLQRFGIDPSVTIFFGLAPLPPAQLAQVQSVPIPGTDGKSIHYVMAVPQGEEATYDVTDVKAMGQMCAILQIAFLLQLQAVQPDLAVSFPRWFIQGMADYCISLSAKQMLGDESYRLYNVVFAEKKLEHFNDKLLTWNWKEKLPPLPDKNIDQDEYFAQICGEIFVQIEKQFGPDALVKIGQGVAKAPKADTPALCKVISDAIGQDFAAWLKNFKCTAKYHVLGFNADPDYTAPGVKAKTITPNSAAAEAGFKDGDILTKINGTEIKDNAQLGHVLDGIGIGKEFTATVKRGDKEIELKTAMRERTTFTLDVNEFPTAPPPQPQEQPGNKTT